MSAADFSFNFMTYSSSQSVKEISKLLTFVEPVKCIGPSACTARCSVTIFDLCVFSHVLHFRVYMTQPSFSSEKTWSNVLNIEHKTSNLSHMLISHILQELINRIDDADFTHYTFLDWISCFWSNYWVFHTQFWCHWITNALNKRFIPDQLILVLCPTSA